MPIARMTCERCEGQARRPACSLCKGAGVVDLDECPARVAQGMVSAVRAYTLLNRHGLLPRAGGWLDQSAWFLDAVRIMDVEASQADG